MAYRGNLLMVLVATAGLLLALPGAPARAVEPPAAVTRAQYDAWMEQISNWGRWGADDELGTLNLITPAVRKAAAALVRDGVAVSLALELNTVADELNANPFRHNRTLAEFGGHRVAGDEYSVQYHGFAHSHLDGLPHFAHKGKMYNGVPIDALADPKTQTLGIHNFHAGVFARAVLVDVPLMLGKSSMEPGTAVTVADLEAWEKRVGLRVGAGDVLLIRTGRWERVRRQGQWNFLEKAAGAHASIAQWLKARDVAVIGCDGVSDVMPSNVEGLVNPLHALVLVGLGMPIFDNLDLDAVAAQAQRRGRWEFLLTAAPLRVRGGTGSPLNPIAVF